MVVVNDQIVTMVLKEGDRINWVLSALYASPKALYQEEIWSYLKKLVADLSSVLLLIGDFNQITDRGENLGRSSQWKRSGGTLWKLIEDANLIDLGFFEPKFIWTNSRMSRHNILECLHRSLCAIGSGT